MLLQQRGHFLKHLWTPWRPCKKYRIESCSSCDGNGSSMSSSATAPDNSTSSTGMLSTDLISPATGPCKLLNYLKQSQGPECTGCNSSFSRSFRFNLRLIYSDYKSSLELKIGMIRRPTQARTSAALSVVPPVDLCTNSGVFNSRFANSQRPPPPNSRFGS